ncbi:hypothetical protein Tco_1219003 [Tanacetum coccineum]
MHTTMVPEQVKKKKIQAGVQVSRLEDKDVIFSIGSASDVILHCCDHTHRLDAMLPTLFADIDRDVGELYTRKGVRPVLELEAWAGRVDTRLANISRDRYDDHRLICDMLVQQATMQRELQEMRGRVTTLEQERDHRE